MLTIIVVQTLFHSNKLPIRKFFQQIDLKIFPKQNLKIEIIVNGFKYKLNKVMLLKEKEEMVRK